MQPESIAPKVGKSMMVLAWIIALGMLTWGFGIWQEHRVNPNQSPLSHSADGVAQVTLMRNRQGHYVTSGTINHKTVVFLVDTGATIVAIPAALAAKLGLSKGRLQQTATANGVANAYVTEVEHLKVGAIELFNVRAALLPNLHGQQILLGMSALRDIEFSQKGDTLTLRQVR